MLRGLLIQWYCVVFAVSVHLFFFVWNVRRPGKNITDALFALTVSRVQCAYMRIKGNFSTLYIDIFWKQQQQHFLTNVFVYLSEKCSKLFSTSKVFVILAPIIKHRKIMRTPFYVKLHYRKRMFDWLLFASILQQHTRASWTSSIHYNNCRGLSCSLSWN